MRPVLLFGYQVAVFLLVVELLLWLALFCELATAPYASACASLRRH